MPAVPPLTVAIPLVTAALLAIVGSHLPRWLLASAATGTAAAVTALQLDQLLAADPHPFDHFFGGWTTDHGFAVGIVFTVDPVNASLAALVGALMVAGLVYSALSLKDVSHVYYVLMLLFLGGMSGFTISGDLFNIFVFFELMSVAGYALCSFRNTSSSVLHGALNFAIVNSIGAFFFLLGIALIYGHTGALNLAQIAAELRGHPPDAITVTAFLFIVVALLVKGGAVPFHFWLSDAYAVAAAPVGVLYAGIMSDLGFHAIATIYAKGFAGSLDTVLPSLRSLLVVLGVVTVVVGAVMCFLQADLKRQIALLVVSHGGGFLIGVGLMSPQGLAGSTLAVITDGLDKGAIFLAVGFVVASLGQSNELVLRGHGRSRRHLLAGAIFALAALGFADLPGFGTWLGASVTQQAADAGGYGWTVPVLAVGAALTGGTMLRSAARVFLGWGDAADPLLAHETPDEPEEGEPREETDQRGETSRWLLAPAAALLVAGFGVAFVPGIAEHVLRATGGFFDLRSYVDEVLHGQRPTLPQGTDGFSTTTSNWLLGVVGTLGAFVVAAAGLWWQRMATAARVVERLVRPGVEVLHAVHNGRIGDMAAWLAAGAAAVSLAGLTMLR